MEFKIRTVKEEDYEFIAKLYEKVWEKYENRINPSFLKMLFDSPEKISSQIKKGDILFLADVNNKVVGIIRGSIELGNVGKISMLAVDPNFRKIGIGQKLLNKLIQIMHEKNIKKLYLYTHSELKEAIYIYKKLGFKKEVTLHNFWFGESFLLMTLDI